MLEMLFPAFSWLVTKNLIKCNSEHAYVKNNNTTTENEQKTKTRLTPLWMNMNKVDVTLVSSDIIPYHNCIYSVPITKKNQSALQKSPRYMLKHEK